jgi:hypothetical protein
MRPRLFGARNMEEDYLFGDSFAILCDVVKTER